MAENMTVTDCFLDCSFDGYSGGDLNGMYWFDMPVPCMISTLQAVNVHIASSTIKTTTTTQQAPKKKPPKNKLSSQTPRDDAHSHTHFRKLLQSNLIQINLLPVRSTLNSIFFTE
jgi:hypothetical protein